MRPAHTTAPIRCERGLGVRSLTSGGKLHLARGNATVSYNEATTNLKSEVRANPGGCWPGTWTSAHQKPDKSKREHRRAQYLHLPQRVADHAVFNLARGAGVHAYDQQCLAHTPTRNHVSFHEVRLCVLSVGRECPCS